MNSTHSVAQTAALADLHALAKALAALPDMRGTAAEIAAALGRSVLPVVRRLKAGCYSRHPKHRLFAVVGRPDYRTGEKAKWGLTAVGVRFVEGESDG